MASIEERLEEILAQKRYIVVQDYNGPTARKTLFQVLTRKMSAFDAADWRDYFIEENSKSKRQSVRMRRVMVVECLSDEEVAERAHRDIERLKELNRI